MNINRYLCSVSTSLGYILGTQRWEQPVCMNFINLRTNFVEFSGILYVHNKPIKLNYVKHRWTNTSYFIYIHIEEAMSHSAVVNVNSVHATKILRYKAHVTELTNGLTFNWYTKFKQSCPILLW